MAYRVAAYVDGFNLYFGLKAKKWRRYYWLDIPALCQSLMKPDQTLATVKYFTARVASPPDKVRRQGVYLEALQTRGGCSIHYGQYLDTPRACPYCGRVDTVPKEKMTDLLIGLEMYGDAMADLFDTCLLVSGDSDLMAAVAKVREVDPKKWIVVAFPPLRHSTALEKAANFSFTIGRRNIAAAQLPEEVPKPDGYLLRRPKHWSPTVP
jgi:uncharacterized LabA/DUF88 family protein